jgi:hypothetical protein
MIPDEIHLTFISELKYCGSKDGVIPSREPTPDYECLTISLILYQTPN